MIAEKVRGGKEKEVVERKRQMGNTVNKHIRVNESHWRRIKNAARERGLSPTRLLISSTLEAIDGRNWPRSKAEIHLLRSAMFAAQAIASDMEAAGGTKRLPKSAATSPG